MDNSDVAHSPGSSGATEVVIGPMRLTRGHEDFKVKTAMRLLSILQAPAGLAQEDITRVRSLFDVLILHMSHQGSPTVSDDESLHDHYEESPSTVRDVLWSRLSQDMKRMVLDIELDIIRASIARISAGDPSPP